MADTPTGDPHLAAVVKTLAPFLPGIAGAVLSMAFGEKLTVGGKALSVLIGLASAVFIAPFAIVLAGLFWPAGDGTLPSEVKSFITFACGLFGMIILGGLAPALARYARHPMGLVRVQVGGVQIGGDLATPPPAGEGGAQ